MDDDSELWAELRSLEARHGRGNCYPPKYRQPSEPEALPDDSEHWFNQWLTQVHRTTDALERVESLKNWLWLAGVLAVAGWLVAGWRYL